MNWKKSKFVLTTELCIMFVLEERGYNDFVCVRARVCIVQ